MNITIGPALAALLLAAISGCAETPREALWETTGKTMGTTYGIQIASCKATICNEQLISNISTRLARLDSQYSHYRKDSDLSQFNRHYSIDWFAASHEFVEIVELAREVSAASNGAFDITVGRAVETWGFGAGNPPLPPAPTDVDLARNHSGYQKLESRYTPAGLRKLDPNLKLDLSAIVKGYAADQIALMLEFADLSNYVIDIGGELRVSGRRGDGELWRVGIASPAEDTPIAFLLAPQTNAVATSGDYRNFYFSEGRRVSHTIDPARGEPVDHPLSSVTVIDPLGARADALATALMVMGPEAGFAFAEQRGIPALFLTRTDASFTTHFTGSMRGYLLER